eukprot:gene14064-16173_t
MDLFLSIPEEISKQLVVKWLNIVDVAKLDSAYLSHNSRATFLGLIAGTQNESAHQEPHFYTVNKNIAYLSWLAKRGYRARGVVIPPELAGDSALLTKFFRICGSSIKRISLRKYRSESNLAYDVACVAVVEQITEHCHNLQTFTLVDGFSENPDLLHQLSLRCPYIKNLTLRRCRGYGGSRNANLSFCALRTFESLDMDLSDNFLAAIAVGGSGTGVGSPHLEELSLERVYDVSTRSFDVVAANCPLLQNVRLIYMNIEDAHVLPIVRSCKHLHTLLIVEPDDSFTDVSLTAIAENCLALHTLRLEECSGITDKGVDNVLKHCTKLRDMSLNGTMFLTDATLYSIAKHCPLLTSLSICHVMNSRYIENGGYFSDAGLAAVAEACTHLQRIAFSTSGALTQDSGELFSDQVKVEVEDDDFEGAIYDSADTISDDNS